MSIQMLGHRRIVVHCNYYYMLVEKKKVKNCHTRMLNGNILAPYFVLAARYFIHTSMHIQNSTLYFAVLIGSWSMCYKLLCCKSLSSTTSTPTATTTIEPYPMCRTCLVIVSQKKILKSYVCCPVACIVNMDMRLSLYVPCFWPFHSCCHCLHIAAHQLILSILRFSRFVI